MAAESSRGLSLPAKFESLAQRVDAAIVLVTPDDVGGLRDRSDSALRVRARQNVWVEFGWFWGALGLSPEYRYSGRKALRCPATSRAFWLSSFWSRQPSESREICQWIEKSWGGLGQGAEECPDANVNNQFKRIGHTLFPCHFRAVRTALDRKRCITCHLLRCKLLYVRFHADSSPT